MTHDLAETDDLVRTNSGANKPKPSRSLALTLVALVVGAGIVGYYIGWGRGPEERWVALEDHAGPGNTEIVLRFILRCEAEILDIRVKESEDAIQVGAFEDERCTGPNGKGGEHPRLVTAELEDPVNGRRIVGSDGSDLHVWSDWVESELNS